MGSKADIQLQLSGTQRNQIWGDTPGRHHKRYELQMSIERYTIHHSAPFISEKLPRPRCLRDVLYIKAIEVRSAGGRCGSESDGTRRKTNEQTNTRKCEAGPSLPSNGREKRCGWCLFFRVRLPHTPHVEGSPTRSGSDPQSFQKGPSPPKTPSTRFKTRERS